MKYILLFAALVAFGCSNDEDKTGDNGGIKLSDTDYSNSDNWLVFGSDESKGVDVFVIYPTTMSGEENKDSIFTPIDDAGMRKNAENWFEKSALDIVKSSCNIYAPFYRQINGNVLGGLKAEEFDEYALSIPREDIFAAFDYYLKNVNKGKRPFVLFGHSQGARMLIEIATELLGNEQYADYADNLVVAYAIGMSVTQEQIDKNSKLKFSQNATDVGVIVSWNSTAPSDTINGKYKGFGTWRQGALVSNPLSWILDGESAEGEFDFFNAMEQKQYKGKAVVKADNAKGLLLVLEPEEDITGSLMETLSRFHGFDIGLYAESIKKNIEDRIKK